MADHNIQYLQQHEINKESWDQCIDRSTNGLIYGYSFYLDHMADHWDGLVLGDYEAVMPLPWRKKYGVYYLYQPFLTAQLGLFGNGVTGELLSQYLHAIPAKFKLWEFSLNHGNLFSVPHFQLYERANYVLDLNKSYEELYSNYRENSKRNNKKSLQYGCHLVREIHVNKVLQLVREFTPGVSETDLARFVNLYYYLKSKGKAEVYAIASKQGELLSSCIFAYSHNRAYYILVGNHPNGKTLGASHALIDSFVRDHSGQNLLLDFEGSDIRNLAFFYRSFGATEEKYVAIKHDSLPWYVKLGKRLRDKS